MSIISSIVNAVYPPRCIACDSLIREEGHICADCNSRINWFKSEIFASDIGKKYFDSLRSLAAHEGAWADIVHNFKYNYRTDLAKPLGRMLAGKVDHQYDVITIVPLHIKRLRERGYNQSALLAKVVSKETGIRHQPDLLKKIKLTPPQVGLSRSERVENIKGAFETPGTRTFSEKVNVPSPHILLIDDVVTTGATVNECAKVLKSSGAARVDVLTLARTI